MRRHPVPMFALVALTLVAGVVRDAAPASSAAERTLADEATGAGIDGVIGAEHRVLLPDFVVEGAVDQAAARANLAATQRLSCGASASLVYRRDVIVFSAHQALEKNGTLDPDLARCVFVVARGTGDGATEERYPLRLETLDHGRPASPDADDDTWNRGNQEDWTVVRLARPVEGIEPYRLPDGYSPAQPGEDVTTVSETTDNWQGSSKPTDRLAQACHSIDVEPKLARDYPAVAHLDCDVGHGASGGAVLGDVASGHPTYDATIIAYTGKKCRAAGLQTCFSIARRLDDDLVARIEGTTALRSTPEDEALAAAQDARLAARRDEVANAAMAARQAPFPARDDPEGRTVATLHARIGSLVFGGRPAQAEALFTEAFRALHDPDQTRPEWTALWLESGESLMLQHRPLDAFQSFRAGYAVAPEALKPLLRLRMAETAPDGDEKARDLRDAYLAGGATLLRAAKAEALLADVEANGLPTADEEGATARRSP